MLNREDEIRKILNEICSLSSSRYRINFLSNYSPSSIRLAHLILLDMQAVRRVNHRVYEIIDRHALAKASQFSNEEILEALNEIFSRKNKASVRNSKYRGRKAAIQFIMDIQRRR